MSTFSQVYKPYTSRGERSDNQHFFHTLLTFSPDYYFHGDFWHSKNVDVYSFLGGEEGFSESVWFVQL